MQVSDSLSLIIDLKLKKTQRIGLNWSSFFDWLSSSSFSNLLLDENLKFLDDYRFLSRM